LPGATSVLKKDWVPTSDAFRHLLTWLDGGVDSGGEEYLEIRRRLVSHFDRKGCLPAEELADETLNRVARRLEEEGWISDAPPHYCYIVARFVFLEHLRSGERRRAPVPANLQAATEFDTVSPSDEKRLDCLEQCLGRLATADRELILEYYRDDQGARIGHRRELAARLGITANALSIRACRIRDKLEACVSKCSVADDVFRRKTSYEE
jgi:DNA-directed RNA polymerase specialized sigma24 family protein